VPGEILEILLLCRYPLLEHTLVLDPRLWIPVSRMVSVGANLVQREQGRSVTQAVEDDLSLMGKNPGFEGKHPRHPPEAQVEGLPQEERHQLFALPLEIKEEIDVLSKNSGNSVTLVIVFQDPWEKRVPGARARSVPGVSPRKRPQGSGRGGWARG